MAWLSISLVMICILYSNDIGQSQASVVRRSKLQYRLVFEADNEEFRQEKSDEQPFLRKIAPPPLDDAMTGSTSGAVSRDNDTARIQLTTAEVVGECVDGICKFCAFNHFNFCLIAKQLKTGFKLQVECRGRVFYEAKIVNSTIKPFCAGVPLVGKVCVTVSKINLKDKSACVGVEFKVLMKTIKFEIACFKLGNDKTDPDPALDKHLFAWKRNEKVPLIGA